MPTTVRMVSLPPRTTAFTVPKNLAVSPLSNAPSSFEEPPNIELTDATLSRISSGSFSWRINDHGIPYDRHAVVFLGYQYCVTEDTLCVSLFSVLLTTTNNYNFLIIPQAIGTVIYAGTPGKDCTESGSFCPSGMP